VQGRLKSAALIALPLVLLTGCAPQPTFKATQAPGLTVEQVTAKYDDGPKAIVDYNVSGLIKVGSPEGGPATNPDQWVAITACEGKQQIALGVIRKSAYTGEVMKAMKAGKYKDLLVPQQCP
jgi:hypothetical protein